MSDTPATVATDPGPAPLAPDYDLARAVAETVAAIEAAQGEPLLSAVYVGGLGADWPAPRVYPYAVVCPASAERARGGVTRSVRVLLAARGADYAAKPAPVEGDETGRLFEVGAVAALSSLVEAVSDALDGAALGAPVDGIAADYGSEPQAPVETAEITVSFSDAQAFGDSF